MAFRGGEVAIASQPTRAVTVDKSWGSSRAWPAIRKFIVTKPLGAIGGGIIVLMALAAIFAEVIAPYDPYEIEVALQFGPPNLAHWFGTDEFGRDVLTRLIYGARMALFIGSAASFLGCTGGALVGVVSAYLGGKTDLIVQCVMDILLAFPLLILSLAIVSVLRRSIPNLILAIAIPMIPRTARIIRASALSIKENMYVEAARAVGSPHQRARIHRLCPVACRSASNRRSTGAPSWAALCACRWANSYCWRWK
jgi:peptide/nickel transport system permease protein